MEKIYFVVKQCLILFLRTFYSVLNDGKSCLVCGKKTLLIPVCQNCRKNFFSVQKSLVANRCRYCGKELLSSKNTCIKCREAPVIIHADSVMPLFSYRLWNKELLYKWKIAGERSISYFFTILIHKALQSLNCNIVIPVPPRKGKIQKNGWDQIDELCQFLSYFYNYKILKLLERRSVEQQKKLNRQERLETIQSAYAAVSIGRLKEELKKNNNQLPEKVVLLDDVSTTGSTVECCSEILKNMGINKVTVLTLFVVD